MRQTLGLLTSHRPYEPDLIARRTPCDVAPRCRPVAAAHEYFGELTDADGTVLLCLHRSGDHEPPTLCGPQPGGVGNGLLLFFRLEAFDAALCAARSLGSALAQEPQVNPATSTREFALWDPDGYYVMVSALS